MVGAPAPSSPTYSVTLHDANIEHVVQELEKQLKIPICFETEELDPKTQGITVREKLQQAKDRDEKPSDFVMLEQIAKETPQSIVDWKLPRYDFKIEQKTADETIQVLLEKFTNYTYSFDQGYLIIRPKKSILDFVIDAPAMANKALVDAIQATTPSLAMRHISLLELVMFAPDGSSRAKVSVPAQQKVNFAAYLTYLCETSRPPTTWFVGGMKGSRILQLRTAPKAISP